ncbi:N(6)-L-threonylcarbamoyladenine synthase family protein [Aspergillus lucknowensis]|uniref:Glycoprotease family-domain-containing protein n=1 Tax=Aspergillus lucknowensis TaxID=176173 RepID=A0ABR4LNW5_9EURO
MLILRAATAAGRTSFCTNFLPRSLPARRGLLTLAIETSCDDTSVAIVSKPNSGPSKIHFLENITSNSTAYQGIHPILALESHQENLATLVNKALTHLPPAERQPEPDSEPKCEIQKIIPLPDGNRRKPDFISVTRGPGMRANLFVGLDTAKALSVAWQIPFIGVHHMQAHLLTPRLVSATSTLSNDTQLEPAPAFPFLSILASGGHTLLVNSTSLTSHSILATTADIALGESLDKVAREILPPSLLATSKNTMYGKILEQFAFPNGAADYADYTTPRTRGEEIARAKRESAYGWSITTPFAETRQLAFSFAFLATAVNSIIAGRHRQSQSTEIGEEERRVLAREVMRVCFEHLASRTVIALESLSSQGADGSKIKHNNNKHNPQKHTQKQHPPVKTLVVSGGVAANKYLMHILRSFLDARGFGAVEIIAPPPKLCTDNAAMIGWAGIEMFEAGFRSELSIRALRKWSLEGGGEEF